MGVRDLAVKKRNLGVLGRVKGDGGTVLSPGRVRAPEGAQNGRVGASVSLLGELAVGDVVNQTDRGRLAWFRGAI